MSVYLNTKFQFSSKILTSFREGVIFTPSTITAKQTHKKEDEYFQVADQNFPS